MGSPSGRVREFEFGSRDPKQAAAKLLELRAKKDRNGFAKAFREFFETTRDLAAGKTPGGMGGMGSNLTS